MIDFFFFLRYNEIHRDLYKSTILKIYKFNRINKLHTKEYRKGR